MRLKVSGGQLFWTDLPSNFVDSLLACSVAVCSCDGALSPTARSVCQALQSSHIWVQMSARTYTEYFDLARSMVCFVSIIHVCLLVYMHTQTLGKGFVWHSFCQQECRYADKLIA